MPISTSVLCDCIYIIERWYSIGQQGYDHECEGWHRTTESTLTGLRQYERYHFLEATLNLTVVDSVSHTAITTIVQ